MNDRATIALPLLRLEPEMQVHESPTRRMAPPAYAREPSPSTICRACNGTGWQRHRHRGRYERWHGIEGRERCPVCRGTGQMVSRDAFAPMR